MLIFLDTEFTGLDHPWPRLISIGLIDESGQEFYAELPPASYLPKVTLWVQEIVLPLLDGAGAVQQGQDLSERLANWINDRGPSQIVTDAPNYDFQFLEALLSSWPPHLDRKPILPQFDAETGERFNNAVETAYTQGLRRHHALDDAKANRLAWIAVQEN